MSTTRRELMLGAASLTASQAVGQQQAMAQQQTKRPNILLILADDLGWGDVGYGRFAGRYKGTGVPVGNSMRTDVERFMRP